MKINGSKFYYSRLSEGERNIYDRICDALLRFEPALSFHAGNGKAFTFDTKKIMSAVLFDNPVFFYVGTDRIITKITPMYIQLNFSYSYTTTQVQELIARLDAQSKKLFRHITKKMSPLAKQLEIHRFLQAEVKPAQPPYNADCFNIIGALLNGSCVCEGFAKAYKLLCDNAGLACIVVTGEAVRADGTREKHSWNITRVGGITAHTDVAWDAAAGVHAYDYFNISDADISADHCFDHTAYPKCEPNKINYFYKNGLIATDSAQLQSIISTCSDKECFSVKLLFTPDKSTLTDFFPVGTLHFNEAQNIIGFSR